MLDLIDCTEIFHSDDVADGDLGLDPGWYWWNCFPGCLPDGNAHGPFPSEDLAALDAADSQREWDAEADYDAQQRTYG